MNYWCECAGHECSRITAVTIEDKQKQNKQNTCCEDKFKGFSIVGRFGFPEVELGILPAWCGTQRLPRLAGLKLALDLAPTGRRMGVAEAVNNGVVDMVRDSWYILAWNRFITAKVQIN